MLSFTGPSWQTAILAQNPTSVLGGKARTASLIVPRVYLSDYFTARDATQLAKLNITHVITVLDRDATIPESIPDDHRLRISVADRSDVDIQKYLTETTEFITAALAENEHNNVLVHCFQGVSRSATVVCAYIVATTTMTASESIAYVQSKRSIVCPNQGFRNQLQAWSTQFYGNNMKRSGSGRVARISDGIAGRIREFKASAGPPTTVKFKATPTPPKAAAS
ncbi:protein-tyrosine phosphatase-like protein [Mycena albidolilacea]|uniref:Protein-tyrosine phosphatase-like protein n=1 Tax=Mycena albidolilacea TaxID=1033008 RepID=A0AAD7ADN6_9AGAR|nr:protein-tyrosine phosphatase-like protein [Mycena albidolilacea]